MNKEEKHGTSNTKWSELQKLYIKLYGEIQGPSIQVRKFEPDPDSDEEQVSEFNSQSI